MMCETMANVPVEEKSSYVLTEDMIDAAMNEQFAYQEDLESEGELSSPEESVDQDSQQRFIAENVGMIENVVSPINPSTSSKQDISVNNKSTENTSLTSSPISTNNAMSVLVIETGLDKNGSNHVKSAKETQDSLDGNLSHAPSVNNLTNGDLEKTVNNVVSESKTDLNILKSMLSNNAERGGIIDLCESEEDNFSEEDDQTEAETEAIDDELRSVMETNLMAEIGITVNNKSSPDNRSVEKSPENTGPKITVKNIAHISNHAFNSFPQNSCASTDTTSGIAYPEVPVTKGMPNKNCEPKNLNFTTKNPSYTANIPVNLINQCPTAIQINKIAVPHSGFVNSQGQRMQCVYVKSTSALPFVINTPTQTTATNSNMKSYVLPVKKGTGQMPAIAALKHLTKTIQPQQTLLLKNHTKVVTVAQKLQKPPALQTVPSLQKKNKSNGPNVDLFKSSLLFQKKNTYIPPDTFPENPTYACINCNDKFLFTTSLANHIERRSMSIRYWCPFCKSELQFYNKCALSIHLRGHSMNLKQIDVSCVTINPLPKDMVEKGVATAFFKESSVAKTTCNNNKSIKLNTPSSNSADSTWNPITIVSSRCTSSNKITTVAGQSKSICYQSPSSNKVNKPITSVAANPKSKGKCLPLLMPKTQNPVKTVSLVAQTFVNNVKEPSDSSSNKSPPKGFILLGNKRTSNAKNNSAVSSIQQNITCVSSTEPSVTFDPDLNSNSSLSAVDVDTTMMLHDDDTIVRRKDEEEELVDVENVDSNVTSTSTDPVSKNVKRKKTSPSSSQTSKPKRNCSECRAYCVNISKHLNGPAKPFSASLACKICNLILTSRCALKIHHRIHLKSPPYKCPDCGKDFTTWDELHAHLKYSCGHLAKCVRFLCKQCKLHFPTQNGLALHLKEKHTKDIYKCNKCAVAFYRKWSLDKHIINDHANETNKAALSLMYLQCEMCPKQLHPQESFLVHAQEHTNNMIYGYKCSMCNSVFANRMAFIIHQIKEKAKKDGADKANQSIHKLEPVEESLQMTDSNSDIEDEPVIIRKYPELNSEMLTAEKDPLSLDDWECTQEQKVKQRTEELCIVCKTNSVVLLPGIDLNRQSLCCKQCVKPLDDDNAREPVKGSRKSLNSRSKSIKDKQSRPNQKNIYSSPSTEEGKIVKSTLLAPELSYLLEPKKDTKKRRMSDVSHNSSLESMSSIDLFADSPPRKKNKKKQKGKANPKGQTHIQGQVIKSRSLDGFTHKCSKCEFTAEGRETFLEHISVHRTDPNTYQCLECGLCFVVLPSLERHLQMHHSIDANSYIESNKACLPQKIASVEEETEDNQCRVCYEIFDCKSSLDKHFRTHGMAFMSRLSKSP